MSGRPLALREMERRTQKRCFSGPVPTESRGPPRKGEHEARQRSHDEAPLRSRAAAACRRNNGPRCPARLSRRRRHVASVGRCSVCCLVAGEGRLLSRPFARTPPGISGSALLLKA
ncbi:hypothetical protein HPB47_009109 [Ixodes persulcatus]|uniref:Uncharacterized protein n=1 Tax=Ixodes persulcatus TaxID=34615 RepID=A0AC60P2V9_IXOPE|nr:hypothetical protein HPB47_009109 [Ixodes persulcatus]